MPAFYHRAQLGGDRGQWPCNPTGLRGSGLGWSGPVPWAWRAHAAGDDEARLVPWPRSARRCGFEQASGETRLSDPEHDSIVRALHLGAREALRSAR